MVAFSWGVVVIVSVLDGTGNSLSKRTLGATFGTDKQEGWGVCCCTLIGGRGTTTDTTAGVEGDLSFSLVSSAAALLDSDDAEDEDEEEEETDEGDLKAWLGMRSKSSSSSPKKFVSEAV